MKIESFLIAATLSLPVCDAAAAWGLEYYSPPAHAGVITATVAPNPGMPFFREVLSAHGRWFNHPVHGSVWQPAPAFHDPGWRPYGHTGRWVWTDLGWYWSSAYPWGWIAFHYGGWVLCPEYRWLWVPGTVWTPAGREISPSGACISRWLPPAPASASFQVRRRPWPVPPPLFRKPDPPPREPTFIHRAQAPAPHRRAPAHAWQAPPRPRPAPQGRHMHGVPRPRHEQWKPGIKPPPVSHHPKGRELPSRQPGHGGQAKASPGKWPDGHALHK
ncbi:DUF6600 domain-containing protein [Verrucomicrobiota bacterium]